MNTKHSEHPNRLTGKFGGIHGYPSEGSTLADSPSIEDQYNHVFYTLVATFDRLSDKLTSSELQEEQTEIASAMAQLGTAIMFHKMATTLKDIKHALPDGSYEADAIRHLADTIEDTFQQNQEPRPS